MDRRNAIVGLAAMAGMGGLNPKPLNAPPAGPLSLGIQPGAPTGVFTRLIVSASGAFTGIFVYSPSPGAGNLVDSITAAAGTDPFGNSYQAGISSYSGTLLTQITAGKILVSTSPVVLGNEWTIQATSTGPLTLFNGSGPGAFLKALGLPASTTLIANDPANSTIAESWHTMSITAAGFAAGTQAPQYQFMPLGSTGQVHLRGAVNLTANQVSGAIFFTLPSIGYRPSTNQEWVTASSLSGASLAGTVSVDTSGNLALGSAGSTGNLVRLDGIVIQL